MAEDLETLKARIKELEELLAQKNGDIQPARNKIEKMSSEVVDSNPYRFGICILLCHGKTTQDIIRFLGVNFIF